MNRDLPDDLGSVDPGVDQLIRTLTGAPNAGELAGEQQALTMFRTAQHSTAQHPTAQLTVTPAPAWPRARWRWRLVLASGAFVTLVGGVAGAAYAAALPASVQNFASRNLGFLGVPPVHHGQQSHTPRGTRSTGPGGHHQASPGQPGPARSGPASHGRRPSASKSPRASKSPKASASPDVLTATVPAAGSLITAGDPATIDGTLTRSGTAVSGATVKLLERPAGTTTWQVVGSGTSTSSGSVTVQVSALDTNAAFRLTGPYGSKSLVVRIKVVPTVTVNLELGAKKIRDVLVVTTQDARPGNVVVLEVQSATGSWTVLKTHTLNANGKTRFVLDARVLKNEVIRVKLRATLRHAASVSATVTVPPPA